MAAVTTSVLGVGLAGYQAYQGMKDKQKAEDALANFDRQDLTNAYENVPISTVGSDLIREEAGRTSANIVDAVRNSDSRTVLGGIPKIQSGNNAMNKDAQAYLDDQVIKRNYAIAGDKANMRNIQEGRDNADLAGIGQQLEVGRQDMWSGLRGIGASAMFAANNISGTSSASKSSSDFKAADLPKDIGYYPSYYSVPNLQGGY